MTRRSLTIIMTNYNHARFLPRSLNAIVNQSRQPDQLILFDDASKDDSVEVMRRYADKYPFIKLVASEKNFGCTPATQECMQWVTGDYVHRAAADDYMLPGFIQALMDMAERYENVGIVSCALAHLSDAVDDGWYMDGTPDRNPASQTLGLECGQGYFTAQQFRDLQDATTMSPMASLAPSTFFRTDLVRRFGGWMAELGMHEVSFILRAAALDSGMGYDEAPLYTWIWRENSITDRELKDVEGTLRYCRRNLRKMLEPPFDELFSDTFRRRWAQETEAILKPPAPYVPPKLSRLQELLHTLGLK